MFRKKTCKKCKNKIEKKFSYCPYCGSAFDDKENENEDYGLLGKEDVNLNNFLGNPNIKLPLGFNTIFKKLMSQMEKQMKNMNIEEKDDEKAIVKKGGITINISNESGTPIIKVKSFGNLPGFEKIQNQAKPKAVITKSSLSEEKAKELSKLPRQEAESKVRRLSGRVIYEIEVPEVTDINNVLISQLENSIEVKAFAKDKAYFKFLPIALPLLKYKLAKEKLILELGEE